MCAVEIGETLSALSSDEKSYSPQGWRYHFVIIVQVNNKLFSSLEMNEHCLSKVLQSMV